MDDTSGIRESFESTAIQLATSLQLSTTIAAALVKNAAVMAPIAQSTAETVRREIDDSVRNLVLTPPSPPPSGSDSSLDESQRDHKKQDQRKGTVEVSRL